MTGKKTYSLTVARPAWPSERPIIVAQIPWDHFCREGGPDSYAFQISRSGAIPVIVAKSPDGKWGSATEIERVWGSIMAATPIDSLLWHSMQVEADHYPWELWEK